MSLTQLYPGLPPLARGSSCPLKLDTKGDKLLYKSGNTVVLRDVEPTAEGKIGVMLYTQHSYPVTAAAMAPSGCYIASGDDHGNLRIWACDTPDQIIKLETPLFAGAVLDIAWSGDSQRVLAVGDGGAIFGKVRGARGRRARALLAATPTDPALVLTGHHVGFGQHGRRD